MKVVDRHGTKWNWSIFGCFFAALHIKNEDENNRSGFFFRFLNFSMWDMMVFELGVDFDAGVDGSRIAVRLPFLMLCLKLLPCLDYHHRTWRTQRFPYGWDITQNEDQFLLHNANSEVIKIFGSRSAAARWARKNGK